MKKLMLVSIYLVFTLGCKKDGAIIKSNLELVWSKIKIQKMGVIP